MRTYADAADDTAARDASHGSVASRPRPTRAELRKLEERVRKAAERQFLLGAKAALYARDSERIIGEIGHALDALMLDGHNIRISTARLASAAGSERQFARALAARANALSDLMAAINALDAACATADAQPKAEAQP